MYNAAIDIEGNRFHDLVMLGNASYYNDNRKLARKLWEQALHLDPKGPYAKILRANGRTARSGGRAIRKGRGQRKEKHGQGSVDTPGKLEPIRLDQACV